MGSGDMTKTTDQPTKEQVERWLQSEIDWRQVHINIAGEDDMLYATLAKEIPYLEAALNLVKLIK